MNMKKIYSLAVILFVFPLILAAAAPGKSRLEALQSQLSCFCGTCPHLSVRDCTCSKADEIRQQLLQKIDAGMSDAQIIKSFVDQYGQTVLSTPPKKGFSLTAWVLPFLGFAVGGTVLVVFLKRQQKGNGADPSGTSETPEQRAEEEYYGELLDKELDERK
jgi:cytochrome c-type biogenesis protein CcmH